MSSFLTNKGGGEDTGGSGEEKSESQAAKTESDSKEGTEGPQDNPTGTGTTPDSPSKQLPDQISFFSGNPSVEIVHGIMHLYKTKYVPSEMYVHTNAEYICHFSVTDDFFVCIVAAK